MPFVTFKSVDWIWKRTLTICQTLFIAFSIKKKIRKWNVSASQKDFKEHLKILKRLNEINKCDGSIIKLKKKHPLIGKTITINNTNTNTIK